MIETVEWLHNNEQLAHDLYDHAAALFPEDIKLTQFLGQLAEDEADHCVIMGSATEYVRKHNISLQGVIVDPPIKNKIDAQLQQASKLVACGEVTIEQLLDLIIDIEFHELNDIFIFVVNTLKKREKCFCDSAARIQNHLDHIETYFKESKYGRDKLEQLKSLPAVWEEKVLIVDDDEATTIPLSDFLKNTCLIDIAYNGNEAIEMIMKNHYDLILSNVDMPLMNGIELYKQASEFIEDLNRKFIFHTKDLPVEEKIFFGTNNVKFLQKPSSIKKVGKIIEDTLKQNRSFQ